MGVKKQPRQSLAINLRYLMDDNKLSEAALAKRCGLSQKAINNILNCVSAPTLDSVERLARAFGLDGWHLILPDLPRELVSGNGIERLYRRYISASPEGRDYIDRVAERESSYK